VEQAGKTAVEVVADYLRLLWDHTITSMKRERGSRVVDGLPFKVVLSVPAIWKPYALSRMLVAARMAGILDERLCGDTTLHLVSEPEAAALATLSEYRGRTDIVPGDVFVVCDVGGGTTDIISYRIEQTEPLLLRESVEGKGKLCGAIFVDEKFESLIQNALRSRWDRLTASSIKRLMNNDWEFGIKRSFDGDPSKIWNVQVPPEAVPRFNGLHRLDKKKGELPIVNGQIQVDGEHVKDVFGEVIDRIRHLVNEQKAQVLKKEGKLPRGIILVGGFGSCNYLYERLREEHDVADGVSVLQARGNGPWVAIARGALIKAATNGLSSIVRSKVSRLSYGARANSRFVDGKHSEEDKYWCEYDEGWYARRQMHWCVKKVTILVLFGSYCEQDQVLTLVKGDDIDVLKPVTHWFSLPCERPLEDNKYEQRLYCCEEDDPPSRGCDPRVKPLCYISSRFDVDFEQLPKRKNSQGLEFRSYKYKMEATAQHATLNFAVFMDGRKQAEKNIDVDYESITWNQRVSDYSRMPFTDD
jgi:hypothetical protein